MDFLKAPILVLALLSDLNMAVGATIDDFLREPSRPPNIALSKGDFDQLLVRAEAGDIEAQYLMGNAYYNGDFVWQGEPIWPQSVSEARKWWLLSAEKGHSKSQFWLGEMSATGIGIPENYSDAFKWYKLSALNGFSFAQYKSQAFAKRYCQGLYTGKNSTVGRAWSTNFYLSGMANTTCLSFAFKDNLWRIVRG